MRKIIYVWCGLLVMLLFFTMTPVHADDKSYAIDRVAIQVDVDDAGVMHVAELSTYTFDGEFGGTERSILGDASEFHAYEVPSNSHDPTISTKDLDELRVENEDDLYRVHMPAENEEKTILYTYEIKNEMNKYADVVDLMYDFYPSSNEIDIGILEINWTLPDEGKTEDIHAFIRGNDEGTVDVHGFEITYEHESFEGGMSSEVRIVFPADAVPRLSLTKDKQMGATIIQEEKMNIEKKEKFTERLEHLQPMFIIILAFLIGGMTWWYLKHPNRYTFGKHEDPKTLLAFLENTDPLFASYIQVGGYVSLLQSGLVSALLSLKRRGIISMKEVPSEKNKEKTTYAFYWKQTEEEVDEVDAYLHEWLFTEGEGGKEYFLFESLIVDEDESDKEKEKKIEAFETHTNEWTRLLKQREAFSGWYTSYPVYGYVSMICTILVYALFYYVLSITPISSVLQQWLVGIIGVLAIGALVWRKNKWIISVFYLMLIPTLLIASMWSIHLLPIVGIVFASWCSLLIISSKRWDPEVAKLHKMIRFATRLFKRGEYPIDADVALSERRLELAIALGVGKKHAEQLGKEFILEEIGEDFAPLLHNPTFAGTVFHPAHVIFYTSMSAGTSSSSTSMGSSPTSGSGGAGAF